MMKIRIFLFAPLMALLLAMVGGTRADAEMEGPVDFSLEKLGGGTVSVADYRGQWLVVNYWATWCAPCIKEMPELSALHNGRDDTAVLGLAYEEVDDATLLAFLDEIDVDFPILKVDVGQSGRYAGQDLPWSRDARGYRERYRRPDLD